MSSVVLVSHMACDASGEGDPLAELSGAKCPACNRVLAFLPENTDFLAPFTERNTISRVMDHCKMRKHEPLWNTLPKLDLEKDPEVLGRGKKKNFGSVEVFLHYCLKKAATEIPLPSSPAWLSEWKYTKRIVLARLGAASCLADDPCNYMKGWMPNCSDSVRDSEDHWKTWIKESTKIYLQCLVEIVLTSDAPAEAEEENQHHGLPVVSDYLLRNRIQLFFMLEGYHRSGILLDTSSLPRVPQFSAWQASIANSLPQVARKRKGRKRKTMISASTSIEAATDAAGDLGESDGKIEGVQESSDEDEKPVLGCGDLTGYYQPIGHAGGALTKAVVVSIEKDYITVHPYALLLNSHQISRIMVLTDGKRLEVSPRECLREIRHFAIEERDVAFDGKAAFEYYCTQTNNVVNKNIKMLKESLVPHGLDGFIN